MSLKLPGFSAWIDCEGSKLACHAVECSDDGKTATCWIASEVGKTFSVRWSRKWCGTTQDMSGEIYIDGVEFNMLHAMEADKPSRKVFRVRGIDTSSSTMRPFTFANLQLTDENEYIETSNAQCIGDIELGIYRHKKSSATWTRQTTWTTDNPLGEPKIHGRAKKATSHKVKLGDEIKSKSIALDTMVTLGEQLAKFTFKYRPIDVLRKNGIILDSTAYPGSNFATNLEAAHDSGSRVRRDSSNLVPLAVKAEASGKGARAATVVLQDPHIKIEANAQDLAVKEEASEEGARAATVALQELHIKIEAGTQETNGTQVVARHDEEEEDVDVARLQALKQETQKLERKIEMKDLRKRLADLEREDNGDTSTSQGPAKKARTGATGPISSVRRDDRPSTSQVPAARGKRRTSIMDLTGDSD